MLRIDESSNTLVAPQQGGLEPEAPLERTDLLALVCAGWTPFAHELGETHLHLLAVEPQPGVDLLGFDDSVGRVVVILVAGAEDAAGLLGRAMLAAGNVAGWDAQELAGVHEALTAAVPGESPRIMLLGGPFERELLASVDWLARRHGLEVTAHQVQVMRFGSERLLNVTKAYPTVFAEQAEASHPFFADVLAPPAAEPEPEVHSAPPPAAAPPTVIEAEVAD